MHKSDKTTIALRVEEVLKIRLDGAQYHDVLQYASTAGWGVSNRQVSNYILAADNLLAKRLDRNKRRSLARHLAQRDTLFARAVKAADHRTALAVIADKAKIEGHYSTGQELKQLVTLALQQAEKIRELEARINDGARPAETGPQKCPEAGGVGREDQRVESGRATG